MIFQSNFTNIIKNDNKKGPSHTNSKMSSAFIVRLLLQEIYAGGDDSSLPVDSASCTVHIKLFANIDVLYVRPETTYNKQICSTLSV